MLISRKWKLLLLVFALLCIVPFTSAHAYIDPGTGNYLLQLVLAALFGALFVLKMFWAKIKNAVAKMQGSLFKGKKGDL